MSDIDNVMTQLLEVRTMASGRSQVDGNRPLRMSQIKRRIRTRPSE